ncbi:cell envelope biogenesis protein OmpA [Euzebyella marina]|uniref:Cell envelope biogenesis protein OmpA n=1 Tax=Euzebyella marina TaxID=1761453 RepID=A0A3G2LBB9_9FLAO|nr:cell envelope biogenesis protein OmpA [Euzebyella marina]AYN69547.1 cell envelope biogenesis protein OmpA [Euzebyella marina]MAU71265.1 cell envelope biogenesis protein OmpA [Pseudozobellia sp.]MBG46665.1 cell envelope biogenesis protein OmpA [Pseudozobellia sp.]MBG49336.1 cell envelope biogenesis protein OmpA [Pseudozobellia sp.]
MTENDKIQILKDILFAEDSDYIEKIAHRLENLESTLNDRQKFSTKVDPIILHQLEEFKTSIPSTLGPTITAALKTEIKKNKDEVVEAMFPILGKMIKKYIAHEIKLLSEKINKQLSFKDRMKSWFGNSTKKQEIIDELAASHIEQVLLIEKDSGLLKASYSVTQTIDEEMISGMLTAIKSFVEDAFGQKNQNLELIDYELYHIHLQSFNRFYIAVILSGNYTTKAKDKLQDLIFDFFEKFTKKDDYHVLDSDSINKQLAQNFGHAHL